MYGKSGLAVFVFAVSALLFAGSVYASTSAETLLKAYNVPNSLTASATFHNITYSGLVYTLVNVSSTPYFLINTTGQGSFVLNASTAAKIIGPEMVSSLSSKLNFTPIENDMSSYINSSASSLNDCIQETGLNRGTCTLGNYCNSCAEVPSCNKALYATNGPSGPLGEGIMLLEQQYASLESNISIFNEYANGTGSSNATIRSQKVVAAFANISKLTQIISENPLFPPPQNADLSSCGGSYAGSTTFNISSQSGNWYCNAIGYCQFTTYNASMLSRMQLLINNLNSELPTTASISRIAGNITSYENTYLTPVLASKQHKLLQSALNTTLAGFNSTLNESEMLLTHVNNATLRTDVSSALAGYLNLTINYLQVNITKYSQSISSQLSSLRQTYSKLNATYSAVLGEAKNNTAELIVLQLGGDRSNKTSAMSFEQQQLNAQLDAQISNITALKAKLNAISASIPALGSQIDLSPEALSRAIDGPFVSLISGATGMTYNNTVASAPILSALFSLIIGIILFLILFVQYLRLVHHHRIRHSPNVHRAWRMVFIIAAILVALYVIGTYLIAAAASSSAPASAFTGALASSHGVVIAINGTTSPALSNCASQISTYASQRGYKTSTIYLSGSTCTGAGSIMNTSECLNQYARLNIPVILLTQSSGNNMSIYSMYGTIAKATGSQAFINACYIGFLVR